ncbi:hypothetical protein [Cellulomonas marina]|uniref:Uncharacterized protein n=1 Tax=Cellulomonas marina TaxID=988821 RepID=A0A1I1AM74_9CELL|nr:hypothetical protein [Cellulomonas marina]GIG30445.1 hypothetical protein Cma02nite_30450 [Cellulomonas marina]SFB39121.1 hypothetical protein SAMN05421867_12021 [Cellulomonas marina]
MLLDPVVGVSPDVLPAHLPTPVKPPGVASSSVRVDDAASVSAEMTRAVRRRPLLSPGRAVRVRTASGDAAGLVTTRVDRLPEVVYYVLLEGGEELRVIADQVRPTRSAAGSAR